MACVPVTAEAAIRAWRGDDTMLLAPTVLTVAEPVDRVCAMACSSAGDMPVTDELLLLSAEDDE